MNEHFPKLLGLPAPGKSKIGAEIIAPNQTSEIEKKPAVHGRDLNSSDLLLLGVNDSLKKIMSEEYGIDSNFGSEFPTAFSTTSRKVIIDDGKHKYFIKEKPKYSCNPYNLSLSARFQQFLSHRTDFVPRIINTKSGNPYLQIGETHFLTTEFKEGRIFNGSIQDTANAGATLGKIHLLSKEFDFPDLRKRYAGEDTLQFINMADQLKGAQDDEWKQKAVLALKDIVDKYSGQMDQDVPYLVNHADYAPFNLVYDKNGTVVAVNDFDNVDYRPRIRDLAGAVISFYDGLSYAGTTSTLRKPITTSLNLEKAKAFIKGYAANSPALSPKEKAELVGEMNIRWAKIMSLGIVRGDFSYRDVLEALSFQAFVEKNIPTIL